MKYFVLKSSCGFFAKDSMSMTRYVDFNPYKTLKEANKHCGRGIAVYQLVRVNKKGERRRRGVKRP